VLVRANLRSTSLTEQGAEIHYLVDGIERGVGSVQNPPDDRATAWEHFDVVEHVATRVSVQVELRDTGGGVSTVESLRLVAFRLPADADLQLADEPGPLYVSAGAWNEYGNLAFSPLVAERYLVLAVAGTSEAPGACSIGVRLRDAEGATWPPGVDGYPNKDFFHNPRSPWFAFFVARAPELPVAAGRFALEARADLGDGCATLADDRARLWYARIAAFRTAALAGFESTEDPAAVVTTETQPVASSTLLSAGLSVAAPRVIIAGQFPGGLTTDTIFAIDGTAQVHDAPATDSIDGPRLSADYFDLLLDGAPHQLENQYLSNSTGMQAATRESVIHLLRLGP
jgi:hypothetical protein